MKDKIDAAAYDVCLIGCGAYGFPLAAHIKGEVKSISSGRSIATLIRYQRKRWEDPNYGVKGWGMPYGSYSALMNTNWVRPGESERPQMPIK